MVEDKGETKDLSADLFEGIQVMVKTIQSANGCICRKIRSIR